LPNQAGCPYYTLFYIPNSDKPTFGKKDSTTKATTLASHCVWCSAGEEHKGKPNKYFVILCDLSWFKKFLSLREKQAFNF
jgi:hypothetical protein